jgi:signal transduction histidine kinase
LNQELACTGDEAFLHELFLIFLDNAIKYSPDGTRIHVTLGIRGGAIQACFQDQGIGISPEHLPFIFDRFYRAASLNSGEAQSGGLGLAIAQAIAIAQGGAIECESTVGVGSTFTVSLPITQPQQAVLETGPKEKLILR